MTFKNYLEVKVKGQSYFMGMIRLKKASNVVRDRISPNQNNIYLTPSGVTRRHGLVQPIMHSWAAISWGFFLENLSNPNASIKISHGYSMWVTFLEKNFSRSMCQDGRHFQKAAILSIKIYVFE